MSCVFFSETYIFEYAVPMVKMIWIQTIPVFIPSEQMFDQMTIGNFNTKESSEDSLFDPLWPLEDDGHVDSDYSWRSVYM